MKRQLLSLGVAMFGCCAVSQSFAANYPSDTSGYSKSFVYQPQPIDQSLNTPLIPKVMNFTGYYIGVAGTESFFHYKVDSNPGGNLNFDKNRGGVSAFFGYGYEFKSGFYLGGDLNSTYYPSSSLNNNSFGYGSGNYSQIAPVFSVNLDLKPGYEVINHLLVYGLVGVGVDYYQFQNGSASTIYSSKNDVSVGLRLGAGLTYQITKSIFVNTQYVITQGSSIKSEGNGVSQSVNPSDQSISLGLGYKF